MTVAKGSAAREIVLEQAALAAAQAWTTAFRVSLEAEGRNVEGGWPGTLSEARVRATAHVATVLDKRSMTALTYEEIGRVARITYDEARRSWTRRS
jgi:hypothetical protein